MTSIHIGLEKKQTEPKMANEKMNENNTTQSVIIDKKFVTNNDEDKQQTENLSL